jgi:hypothetical protein
MSTIPKDKKDSNAVQKSSGRSTGPKSAKGKAKSSQNAVSHGLTSNRLMPDEIIMVEEFTRELNEYYKPESPLEVLQIQRIAFCRAKLAKLIDIELAGREVARKLIELEPRRVVDRLTQFSLPIRTLALKSIEGVSLVQSIGIDRQMLRSIHQEIRDMVEELRSPEDLPRLLPKLCSSLMHPNFLPSGGQGIGEDQRLKILVLRIEELSEPKLDLEQKGAFEQLLRQVHLHSDFSQDDENNKFVRRYRAGPGGYHESVFKDLKLIAGLDTTQSQVEQALLSFEEMKGWMIRSADISSEESDRMMKYQTMLERRLSSSIGELLELRKYRLTH